MLYRVLGPLETCPPGAFANKPATLLVSLLATPGEWVSCEKLIDAIWYERTPPSSARSNIKSYVWQLRRVLGGSRIEGRSGAYRVCVQPGELDVDCFKQRAADARSALAAGDVTRAVEHLTAALELWRGTPFTELPSEMSGPVVANLTELRWELRETLADAFAAQSRYQEAIAELRALTVADPLREGPWAQLVRTLHQAGRRSEALAVYEDARAVLDEELGVAPGAELSDACRAAMTERQVKARCELPRDVPDFTGRGDEVARLLDLSRTSEKSVPVAVIDGMPGVGKTALAVHVAHSIAEQFPDGQLFLDLGNASAAGILARLLRTLGVTEIPADVSERAALWRASLVGLRLLLVFDDVRDTAQIEPLLPGSPGCMVLVTTRTRLLRLPAVDAVSLDPLGQDQAAQLLLNAGDWRMGAAPQAVQEVTNLCAGLPAAIRTAAMVFRSRPKWTANQVAAWLADEPAAGVSALIESAVQRLAEEDRRMLDVAALLPEVDVPAAAQAAGIAAADARRLLENLVDQHFLSHHPSGKYTVHRVVRDFTRGSSVTALTAQTA
jgi:DNA-binding SARP family transcriptional activator